MLPPSLDMGPVTLRVADVDTLLRFYTEGVGLDVLASTDAGYILGHGPVVSLILEHSPELRYASSSEAGLFHSAFLFPEPQALAHAVGSVISKYPGSFTGSADHLVSEAFYFDDPEGNGVELYVDRDRASWSWRDGQVEMATLPLDPRDYLARNLGGSLESRSRIGHVHLSVGNIEQANAFYVNALGFDVTLNWGGTALFVSAGGYHHHMAMNVWRSRGAGFRQQTLGLGEVSVVLPDIDSLGMLGDRLRDYGLDFQHDGQALRVLDPWGNQVSVSTDSRDTPQPAPQ